ncbi:VIT1/CCC1 transporter family protein [Patescibacteria group bacterium]|nr:VIT1/CCC1 transporter family protein [Patescibacteria group bacterium]MBU1721287.1 VIT1/CCC1 transporter family protein [Patescibacteria group bacterium]MBU1901005.1 VIT1/CCC1 transporter family protein [Patescibacteria group bacterium]
MSVPHNPKYIHHKNSSIINSMREVVFGMEDGMVSTLGAITGVALAVDDRSIILLTGFVIVAVESISMATGSYISSKSLRAIDEQKLREELEEVHNYPEEEKKELITMYTADGWSPPLAKQMAEEASRNKELFLNEMALRELHIFPNELNHPFKDGFMMGISYIIGGSIPIIPYIFGSTPQITTFSILFTFITLFGLGAAISYYSKRAWWKSGFELLLLAGFATLVGYAIGQITTWLM